MTTTTEVSTADWDELPSLSGENTVALLVGGTPTSFLPDAVNSTELFGCPFSPEGAPVAAQELPVAVAQTDAVFVRDGEDEYVLLCGGFQVRKKGRTHRSPGNRAFPRKKNMLVGGVLCNLNWDLF